MEVTISNNGTATIIKITDRLDTVTAPVLGEKVAPVLEGDAPNIILDCSEIAYISSSGLRQVLALQKTVTAKNGQLTIKGLNNEVKEVFNMTGFTALFKFE